MKLYQQLADDLTVLIRQDPGCHRAIIAVAEGYAYA